jgi:hypothetical protein
MARTPFFSKPVVVCILLFMLVLMGCVVGELRKVDVPQDMTVFKDTRQKMEFKLPAGWEPTVVDPVIEKETKLISSGTIAFKKGERGAFSVWCNIHDNNRAQSTHLLDVLRNYAPMFEHVGVQVEIDSPGSGFLSRPRLNVYKVSQVSKGRKQNFQIVTVYKSRPAATLYGCDYMILGRSMSDEYSEEILRDITAIAATLTHPGE